MNDIFVLIEHFQGKVSDLSYSNLVQANILAKENGGKVVGILLGSNAEAFAADLSADSVIYCDNPALENFTWDAYINTLAQIISDNKPGLVLFGSTTIGAEISSGLSCRLDIPLVSDCREIRPGSPMKAVSQICGGKIMTECEIPGDTTTLITLIPGACKPEEGKAQQSPAITTIEMPAIEETKVTFLQYIEPDLADVDITQESILIDVGRGLENADNLEPVQDLAELLNGSVCATRPVIDQNWLGISRLVGKSGLAIKPKLLFCLGVSGAPEHTEAFSGSDMIIAVNTDPKAPIFDIAKYGAVVDMHDLVEAMMEQLEE